MLQTSEEGSEENMNQEEVEGDVKVNNALHL